MEPDFWPLPCGCPLLPLLANRAIPDGGEGSGFHNLHGKRSTAALVDAAPSPSG
uniref:Uncharacterized protein n=1 Tax=Setaria italica TaxID=4555 RepID=K3XU70_SETIT